MKFKSSTLRRVCADVFLWSTTDVHVPLNNPSQKVHFITHYVRQDRENTKQMQSALIVKLLSDSWQSVDLRLMPLKHGLDA